MTPACAAAFSLRQRIPRCPPTGPPGGGLAPTEVGVMSKKESSRHPCFCPPHQGSCTEALSGFKS